MNTSNIKLNIGIGLAAVAGLAGSAYLFNSKKKSSTNSNNQQTHWEPVDETCHHQNSDIVVLIGDIGGTNCRLELYNVLEKTTISEKYLSTNDFPGMEEALKFFVKDYEGTPNYPIFGCIAIAGYISNNTLHNMANANWSKASGNDIAESLGLSFLKLLNDFEAIGYSILKVDAQKLVALNPSKPNLNINELVAIVGPGTGLGVALLTSLEIDMRMYYKVIVSEGGHIGLPPRTETDFKLHKFLHDKAKVEKDTYVRVEYLCSGIGIPYMYQFIKENEGITEENPKLKELGDQITGGDVFIAAKEDKDPIAIKTVEMFIQNLAVACNTYSMVCIPKGGIVLVGNIVQYIKDYFTENSGDWDNNTF